MFISCPCGLAEALKIVEMLDFLSDIILGSFAPMGGMTHTHTHTHTHTIETNTNISLAFQIV
jgi:hypothetical protein